MNYKGKFTLAGIFLLSLVFGLAGCTGTAKTTDTTANKTTTEKPTTEKPTTDSKPKSETTAEVIGIEVCDDFIKKYDACVSSKVPEQARSQYKASIDMWRKQWKDLAANPQTKSTLADVCKRSLEETRKSMVSFSCEW